MNLKNILKLFVGFYFVWFAIGIIGGVLSPANASQSPSTTMQMKASVQKLGATCLIKMLEGEIVHLYEDKIKEEWYLYVLKAYYPRCPTSEVEGNIWLKFN